MARSAPARLLETPLPDLERGWKAWPVRLPYDREPCHVAAADGPVRLSDLVPVARALASRLAGRVRRHAESRGIAVPCCKGCAACCNSLVPLSIPETFRLIEDLQAMPDRPRKALLAAFRRNARRVVEAGPPELPADSPASKQKSTEATGRWYDSLKLSCPFLAEGVCTIYPLRPLACREYMVRTDPSLCEGFRPGVGERLELPVSTLEVLVELVSEQEDEPPEAVMMPIAVEWARLHPRRAERTWRAHEIFPRFVEMLQDALDASRRSAVA